MKHADVTISILTYNALAHAKKCIQAVLVSRGSAKLILTSNGRTDVAEYFQSIADENPNVSVIKNAENLGFIEPNNTAFDLCKTKYFALLNDDAIPPFDWLEQLKVPFAVEGVAVVGAKGGGCTLTNDFIGYKGPLFEYVEASCMMVDCEKVRPLLPHGLFAPYLSFAYTEDADLSLRVRQRGMKIARANFKLVEHARSVTTRTIPGLGVTMRKNFQTCARIWAPYFKTRKFPHEAM